MSTVYRVLARKYRPTTLTELVGQEMLAQALTQGIEANRLPHAFLLHGIRGVGKTTTARILARSLNCLGVDGKGGITPSPCGVCASCVSINEDRHLDVIEMDAASRTGVDDIREVIESSRYKAVVGRFKVFIIDEVHMLSKSAFNALLKTLEEPPPHVKFIFATTEIHKIPETILSRCMRFDLKRIEPEQLKKHLKLIAEKEGFQVEQEALVNLARAADGSLRDGLSLLDQAIALASDGKEAVVKTAVVQTMLGLADRERLFLLIRALFEGDVEKTLTVTQSLMKDGGDPVMILQDILDLVYWLTCLKTVPQLQKDVSWPLADRQQGMEIAGPLSVSLLMRAWQLLLKGYEEVNQAPSPSQALEMVLIRLCYMADIPSLHQLLDGSLSSSDLFRGSKDSRIYRENDNTGKVGLERDLIPTTLPSTFEEMVKLVETAKEPILFSHLLHDVYLISYKPGEVTVRLSSKVPSNFVQNLKQILNKLTNQDWLIQVREEQGQSTIMEQKQKEQKQAEQQILDHPIVAAVKEIFPGTKATFID
jgi:DNA polymerase-3 subunit gamma/tau